jgi:hypothetical protein
MDFNLKSGNKRVLKSLKRLREKMSLINTGE